jgi:hypothetical protein
MPSTVTAFSVKVAFPGSAAMELIIAREVIARWNSRHALAEKRILLPLEEESSSAPHDLLVAFFCNACAGTDGSSGEAEAEIEKQLKGGKPALIFFSDAREDLTGHPVPQSAALVDFKKRYGSGLVESYADEKEFSAKFAQQLELLIASHEHFRVALPAQKPAQEQTPDEPLSESAQVILFEACDDFEGYIGRVAAGGMLRIQANGKQLVDPQDAPTIAKWDGAFHELLSGGYIRGAGMNGQLFQISPKGFEFLKSIGRNPVGYIAELGGM